MGMLYEDRRGYLTPIYGGELKDAPKPPRAPTVLALPPPKPKTDQS